MTNFIRRINTQNKSFLPAFVVGAAVLASLSVFLQVMSLGVSLDVANKPVPRLVETKSGEVLEAEALAYGEHSNESIKTWIAQTMYGLYDWRGILPPQSADEVGAPKRDPGNPIELENGERKVTSATWDTSWRLTEDFRKPFLRKMANLTPQEVFSNPGSFQASLVPRLVGVPERIGKGEWKVDYIGFLVLLSDGDNVGEAIAINKRIYIRHVDTPPLPEGATEMQKTIYQARKDELEIYQIQDIPKE